VPVYGGLSFHELAVNTYHACGISGAAEVPDEAQGYCWGGDWSGQVGDGDSRAPFEPRAVDGDLRFRSIDAGQAFSCGTTFDGTTQCWGENEWGQLGRTDSPERCITAGGGDVPCSLVPVPISGGPSLETVVTGSTHACGLTADGAAFCWGDNRAGQLGIGASDDSALPTAVVGGHRFVSLSAGHAHTCGLDAEGIAYCWGANDDGALGTMENVEQCGTGACSREPVAVAGGALRFRSISASRGPGGSHSCGVSRDGEAYCWGSNADGQLGTGIHGGHAEPVLVRLQLPLERRTGEGLPAGTP
jgi:alpha-tubulin suppressor-like RCC1 family protein